MYYTYADNEAYIQMEKMKKMALRSTYRKDVVGEGLADHITNGVDDIRRFAGTLFNTLYHRVSRGCSKTGGYPENPYLGVVLASSSHIPLLSRFDRPRFTHGIVIFPWPQARLTCILTAWYLTCARFCLRCKPFALLEASLSSP